MERTWDRSSCLPALISLSWSPEFQGTYDQYIFNVYSLYVMLLYLMYTVLLAIFDHPSHKLLQIPLNVHIVHTLAHIELNAVDMYADTLLRFSCAPAARELEDNTSQLQYGRESPYVSTHVHAHPTTNVNSRDYYLCEDKEYVADIASIITDEIRHFRMARDRLAELSTPENDYRYGCMPAMDALWLLGVETRDDLAARLAVIPLSQEARGLDSASRFMERLYACNDHKSADIVRSYLYIYYYIYIYLY